MRITDIHYTSLMNRFNVFNLRLYHLSDHILPWLKLLWCIINCCMDTHNIQKHPVYETFHLMNLHCLGSAVKKSSGNSSSNSICQFLPFLKGTVNLFLPGNEVENLLGIQYCYLRTSLWQCLGFRQNNSAIPHYGYFQAVDSWNRHAASEITLILFLLYISKSSK